MCFAKADPASASVSALYVEYPSLPVTVSSTSNTTLFVPDVDEVTGSGLSIIFSNIDTPHL